MSLHFNPERKIKHFLRQDEVEVITQDGWYWQSGHWQRSRTPRSLLAEMLPADVIPSLTSGDGAWYLPGTPP